MANLIKTLIGLVLLLGLIGAHESQRIYRSSPSRGPLRSGRRFLRAATPTHHHHHHHHHHAHHLFGRGETLVYTNSYGHHAYPRHNIAYVSATGVYAGTRWVHQPRRPTSTATGSRLLAPSYRGMPSRAPVVSANSTSSPVATNSSVNINGTTTNAVSEGWESTPISSNTTTTTTTTTTQAPVAGSVATTIAPTEILSTFSSNLTTNLTSTTTTVEPASEGSVVETSMYSPVEPLAENNTVTSAAAGAATTTTTTTTASVPLNEPEVTAAQPAPTSSPVVASPENSSIAPEQPAPSTTAPRFDSSPIGNDALDIATDSSAPFNEIN